MEAFGDQQPPEVRQVFNGGRDLNVALSEFAQFCDGTDELWANSLHFDCTLLAAAHRTLGREHPWEHWQPRDLRTLQACSPHWPKDLDRQGTEHNALHDAQYQALCVAVTVRRQLAAVDQQHRERDDFNPVTGGGPK